MAIALANNFNGTDGTAVTVGNSGGALGDPWSGINLGGGTLLYDTARAAYGSASLAVATFASNLTFVSKAFGSTQTDTYVRVYLHLGGVNLTQSRRLWVLNTGGTNGTLVAALRVKSDGKVDLEPSGTANVAVSATTLPTNQWVRLECRTIHSATAGQMVCQIFAGADPHATTPTETFQTNALQNTGANSDAIRIGGVTAVAGVQDAFSLDEWAVSYDSYPGPALTATAAAVNLGVLAGLAASSDVLAGAQTKARVHYAYMEAPTVDPDTPGDYYVLRGGVWLNCKQYVLRGGVWR